MGFWGAGRCLLGRVQAAPQVSRLVELRLLDTELVGRTLRRDLARDAALQRRRPGPPGRRPRHFGRARSRVPQVLSVALIAIVMGLGAFFGLLLSHQKTVVVEEKLPSEVVTDAQGHPHLWGKVLPTPKGKVYWGAFRLGAPKRELSARNTVLLVGFVWAILGGLALLGFRVLARALEIPNEALLPYLCVRAQLPDGGLVWMDPLFRFAPFGELPEAAAGGREAYLLPEPGKPLQDPARARLASPVAHDSQKVVAAECDDERHALGDAGAGQREQRALAELRVDQIECAPRQQPPDMQLSPQRYASRPEGTLQ